MEIGGRMNNNTTVLILQARLDSNRLHRKALLPLGGRPMILRVMQALARVPAEARVLACPDDYDCRTTFGPLAGEAGFILAPGSNDDVLARYCNAIRLAENSSGKTLKYVIRATGDNPFVFADAALSMRKEAGKAASDYAGYQELPYGSGVEVVLADALFKAEKEAKEQPEREHVCPYLYGHPELFALYRPLAPKEWRFPKIRITVDTPEDYHRACALWEALEDIPEPERYYGKRIIDAYKRVFETLNPSSSRAISGTPEPLLQPRMFSPRGMALHSPQRLSQRIVRYS
jgi:spore coat polysaccharide biosynthesis protein SpsF